MGTRATPATVATLGERLAKAKEEKGKKVPSALWREPTCWRWTMKTTCVISSASCSSAPATACARRPATGSRRFGCCTTCAPIVVLDVAMPVLDGWQTLERVRDVTDVPVMMLTARDGELEKVRGLKAGADDYVTKPFGRQELVARVEALLRRAGDREGESAVYDDGLVNSTSPMCGRWWTVPRWPLTPLEFRLLATFVRHPDQVLSRDQLLELVWHQGVGGPDRPGQGLRRLPAPQARLGDDPRRSRPSAASATATARTPDCRRAPGRARVRPLWRWPRLCATGC